MDNDHPTKIVSNLYKRFVELRKDTDATKYDYEAEAQIKKELFDITTITGAIEVMSKNSIIKLCAMESSLRFMPLHSFLIKFSQTVEYIK
jgi:hypothetical protein